MRATKLLRPRPPSDAVDRPRLLEALDRNRERALVLLCGPAGFGKTTLLSQWLGSPAATRPVAWVTVDEGDDLSGLVAHMLAALRALVPGIGRATLGLLRLPRKVGPARLGEALADELAALAGELVLVLDDLQETADPEVYALLDAVLRHPPTALRLVVATRLDPPLSLARLRARGQLLELRSPDLRFTAPEAARFFGRALPAVPSAEAVTLLTERTEGWAAGLRLAAVAGGQAQPSSVVEAFTGRRQAAVLEYLLEEVLDRQSPLRQEFLLRSAISERLCAPLADALLATGGGRPAEAAPTTGSPAWPPAPESGPASGAEFLAAVARANLFITSLDGATGSAAAPREGADDVVWYRYHSLFRDLLLRQLEARQGPDGVAALHVRAGAWFASRGMVEEGLHHLLAAGDHEAAAALVERHAQPALSRDAWTALERWMNRLPAELPRRRPALAVAAAWVAYRRGPFGALRAQLATARALLDASPGGDDPPSRGGGSDGEGDRRLTLQGELDVLSAILHWSDGDFPATLAAAGRALDRLPPGHHHSRGLAVSYAALAALVCDGADAAARWLEVLGAAGGGQHPAALSWALIGAGCAQLLGGRLETAARLGRALLRAGTEAGLLAAPSWGHILLGAVHYEWNRLDAAVEHFAAAVAPGDAIAYLPLREGTIGLALALQAQGRPVDSAAALDRFEDAMLKTANTPQIAVVETVRAHLALLRDEPGLARRWLHAESSPLGPPNWLARLVDTPVLTRVWARLRLAAETPDPAAERAAAVADLVTLEASAERSHVVGRHAATLALLALAQDALGQGEAALATLTRAIDAGEPAGLIRTFLDLGEPLHALLRRLTARRAPSAYVVRLLAAWPAPAPPAAAAGTHVEPLTEREQEVLERLGRRWSNKEIAAELHVTLDTVKTHAAHVYAKLGVAGRLAAVRRAAELGLLPPA